MVTILRMIILEDETGKKRNEKKGTMVKANPSKHKTFGRRGRSNATHTVS